MHPEVDWPTALDDYFDEYDDIGMGPDARSPRLFTLDENGDRWSVRQTLDDPSGHHGWAITASVDLPGPDDPDDMPQVVDVAVVSG